ncbi:MAG: outer membrane beta-barrel protein [Chitinophagaceae bacterium]|nr:outer membrane beta-barrel protein [Chitinophagaceae bacterium]
MKIVIASIFSFFFLYNKATAQDSSKLSVSGYIDVYYQFDFDKPQNHQRSFFLYNHKRHNEVNVNLAFAKVNYLANKVRANLAVMTGNYPQYNLAAEPQILQHIYEANIGIELSKKNKIWLDAGIMPSHIGFESAVSADCYTLSRGLLAENSPYFETGIKLTKTNKKKMFL